MSLRGRPSPADEEKSTYILTSDKPHAAFDPEIGERRLFNKGEGVPLTRAQFQAFRNKFDSLEVVRARANVAKAQADAAQEIADKAAAVEAAKTKVPDVDKLTGGSADTNKEPAKTENTPVKK
jgi:hypothetical protein